MRRRYMRVNSFTQFDINDYLTIEALDDNLSVIFVQDIEFGVDGIGWKKLTANTPSPVIEKGQTISFRAKCIPMSSHDIGTFSINKQCNLLGNIMSLLSSDNLESVSFGSLFKNCNTIRDASNLKLPATTLIDGCYQYMFEGCTSLVNAPELPATTLADQCYLSMFEGCTSLVNAPELPATTLSYGCYTRMFKDCTSLVNAPELPATTLANTCYSYMFEDCRSLTKAPELPATTLGYGCYSYMFYSCNRLTKAPKLPATTLTNLCYSGMFYGCTSLVNAPELPATTLANTCYSYMFNGCKKLNYIKAMFTTTPSSSYTEYWVRDIASSGTFVKNKNATWNVTGANGVPSGWTVQNATS